MLIPESGAQSLPDVANEARADHAQDLDWVGMAQIALPISMSTNDGTLARTPARVDVFVNLAQTHTRGIHMSRLYLELERQLSGRPLEPRGIRQLLADFLVGQGGASTRARIRIRFDHLLRRRALVTETYGWKAYPVTITGTLEGSGFELEVATEVVYSSTCPSSAALARQLIQQQFAQDFAAGELIDHARVLAWLGSEQGINATPHAQRSRMQVRVRLAPELEQLPTIALIDRIEAALATPVQTAVKREDEQAFARLNGANLMFCEDAGRRVRSALAMEPGLSDFWARAIHEESLHAHDAVCVVTKGVAGGFDGDSGWVG